MPRIIVTFSASRDQAKILDDLNAKAGKRTAAKYRLLFGRLYDRLGDHPDMGPLRPALGPLVRIGIVTPYIVIYEHGAKDDTVTILRIVHSHRDITVRFLTGTR
jgi:toxin ParE1/3/4